MCWLKYGQYVHGAKRHTTGTGSNTVGIWGKETYYGCSWGKETYYWCGFKYGKYMGQKDLLLVLAQIR